MRHPHLHVSGLARADKIIDATTVHFVTGLVTAPTFVRMLIEEFDVDPIHSDWNTDLS